jgi:hypothetical protein
LGTHFTTLFLSVRFQRNPFFCDTLYQLSFRKSVKKKVIYERFLVADAFYLVGHAILDHVAGSAENAALELAFHVLVGKVAGPLEAREALLAAFVRALKRNRYTNRIQEKLPRWWECARRRIGGFPAPRSRCCSSCCCRGARFRRSSPSASSPSCGQRSKRSQDYFPCCPRS